LIFVIYPSKEKGICYPSIDDVKAVTTIIIASDRKLVVIIFRPNATNLGLFSLNAMSISLKFIHYKDGD